MSQNTYMHTHIWYVFFYFGDIYIYIRKKRNRITGEIYMLKSVFMGFVFIKATCLFLYSEKNEDLII